MAEDTNGGGIRITNREVYDSLLKLEKTTDHLVSRVDYVLGENVELRKRVRGLELKFYGILAGLVGAVAVLLTGSIGGGGLL
jgi:hypothetical protein